MRDLSTGAIYDAIASLEREASFRWNVGGRENLDRYRDLQRIMKDAQTELRALDGALPRLRALKAEADRQYDRYVTREPSWDEGGCSCHINPPCSYCTREPDEDTPDA